MDIRSFFKKDNKTPLLTKSKEGKNKGQPARRTPKQVEEVEIIPSKSVLEERPEED